MKGFFDWLLFNIALIILCAFVYLYLETNTRLSGAIALGFFCAAFIGSIFVGIFRSDLEKGKKDVYTN